MLVCTALVACKSNDDGTTLGSHQSDIINGVSDTQQPADVTSVSDSFGADLPSTDVTGVTDTVDALGGTELPADAQETDNDSVSPEVLSLVDNFAWVAAKGSDNDPWYGDGKKAEDEQCEPEFYKGELTDQGIWFEVETSFCGYLTARQPLLADVAKGATVAIHIYHEKILEGEDGSWTLAVAMGAEADVVWSAQQAVPAETGDIKHQWTAQKNYSAGEFVYFHVSNHGDNVWSLVTLGLIPDRLQQ